MIETKTPFTITKGDGLDTWGDPVQSETAIQLHGNLRSQTKIITNAYGKEVRSDYQVLFRGLIEVTYDDTVSFIEANGEEKSRNPLLIKFMRDLDGSVAYTKVML